MHADVAVADGAQHGIGERVQNDVRIRVPAQFAIMVDPDPAEPDVVPFDEGMHIVALADAQIGQRRLEAGFSSGKIHGCRDLDVIGIAFEDMDLVTGVFRDRGIVREVMTAMAVGEAMRAQDEVEAESLGGLHSPQPFTIGRSDHISIARDFLDGVGHG